MSLAPAARSSCFEGRAEGWGARGGSSARIAVFVPGKPRQRRAKRRDRRGDGLLGRCQGEAEGRGSSSGRRAARFDRGEEFHLRAAARAAGDGGKDDGGRRLVEFAANQGPDAEADFAGRAAHPAMVAHAHKPLGQAVEAPAPQKLLGGQEDDKRAVGAALVALETKAALSVVAEEATRAEGGLEDVAGQVAQGRFARAGVARVGDPFEPEDVGMIAHQSGVDLGMAVFEGDFEAVAEARGQRRAVNQEIGLVGITLAAVGREDHPGDDEVDVGMVLELAAPGVQHRGEPRGAAEFGSAEVFERSGGLAQQQVVEDGGVGLADAAQGVGHGEGDQEVGHAGEEAGLLGGGPLLLIDGAALGAGAMVATVVGKVPGVRVAGALPEPPAEGGGAAGQHGPRRPVMGGGEPRSVGAREARPMLAQDLGESQGHGGLGAGGSESGKCARTSRALLSLASVR